ncbi:MAG: maleylacetoacetate isomerase [Gammaproteobacteria bacterium]|nr:maleylacetoacetate isomerase [Gammaproteobacteria bacterium]
MKLYSYWRSSAAYRVRIALNLKGLEHEIVPVNMLKDGGEQLGDAYKQINPQGLVPTLVDGDITLTQSLAILEYLEEQYSRVNLLPGNIGDRARVRQFAQLTACDIHPLNNLRVLKYLKQGLNIADDAKDAWYRHWIMLGFEAFENSLVKAKSTGPYCLGAEVTLADLCLIPQMYNAHRFDVPLEAYPTLCAIEQACLELDAFKQASPEKQIDAT